MIDREVSSTLMNFTPMPAGCESPPACISSRFQTTRPTPAINAFSSSVRISNFSNVPGGNGVFVLMKTPPLLTS